MKWLKNLCNFILDNTGQLVAFCFVCFATSVCFFIITKIYGSVDENKTWSSCSEKSGQYWVKTIDGYKCA